jgi:hypothetical protein
MDLPRLVVIDNLNKMAFHYADEIKKVFRLFDYNIEFQIGVHFKDRFMQRYPTYEVASSLLSTYLDLFISNYAHLISKAITSEVEYKLVNMRHTSLYRQNIVVLKLIRDGNTIRISAITMYKATTSSVMNNPNDYVLLHKKPRFFEPGIVGKNLLKYAKNNEVPEELKCLTKLWK